MSRYQKNIYLKQNLGSILNSEKSLSAHYWVIQKWGGIRSFRRTPKNDNKLRKFYNELLWKFLSKETFSTISSLSKVSSFSNYKNYFIYAAFKKNTKSYHNLKHPRRKIRDVVGSQV